jgi:signal transduction histidine kinase
MKTGDTDLLRNFDSTQVLGVLTGSALLSVNAQGLLTAITPEAEALLNLKCADVLGHEISVLPSALHKALKNPAAFHATGEQTVEIQIPGRSPTNVSLKVIPLAAAAPQKTGFVAVLQDAGARKQIEQHLRRLNTLASIGTLSASMAHEIKNALVAGKTFVELLLEKHPNDELCEIVRRENSRIDAIVAQMLRFSAPGKGGFTAIRLHESLDHSIRLITPKLHSKLVSLDRQFAAVEDTVEGDAYQLQQAFVNLFLNSIDAMPSYGTLSVRTETADRSELAAAKPGADRNSRCVKITIADTGEGIPAENLAHIFEPFFTTKRTGTGLGLSITRGIVEEHDGAIAVDSKPKTGTRFTILLPLLNSA